MTRCWTQRILATTDLDLFDEPLPLRHPLSKPQFLALEKAALHFTLAFDTSVDYLSHDRGEVRTLMLKCAQVIF